MSSKEEHYTRMPKEKKPFAYNTLMKFRAPVIEQIAWEWWGVAPAFKTKIQLIDEILEHQVREYDE